VDWKRSLGAVGIICASLYWADREDPVPQAVGDGGVMSEVCELLLEEDADSGRAWINPIIARSECKLSTAWRVAERPATHSSGGRAPIGAFNIDRAPIDFSMIGARSACIGPVGLAWYMPALCGVGRRQRYVVKPAVIITPQFGYTCSPRIRRVHLKARPICFSLFKHCVCSAWAFAGRGPAEAVTQEWQ